MGHPRRFRAGSRWVERCDVDVAAHRAGTLPHGEQVSRTLPADPEAPWAARRFVVETLSGWGLGCVVDDAELLVSEVVSNVVRHTGSAATTVRVTTGEDEDDLCISVTDEEPGATVELRDPGTVDLGGLGLRLVDSLSAEWGVQQSDAEKQVWFRLPVHASGG